MISAIFMFYEQARNQLGTPGVAKSFQLCPTDFSRGVKSFAGEASPSLRPPGYGLSMNISVIFMFYESKNSKTSSSFSASCWRNLLLGSVFIFLR